MESKYYILIAKVTQNSKPSMYVNRANSLSLEEYKDIYSKSWYEVIAYYEVYSFGITCD